MSRRRIDIDFKVLNKLAEAGCTGEEMAAYFGMHADTLYAKVEQEFNMGFSAFLQAKRSKGKALLRAAQFQNALSGNTQMQIFLGKNNLDQSEKVTSNVTAEVTGNITTIFNISPTPPPSEEDV